MRHIDFGVPDRFRRRQQELDQPGAGLGSHRDGSDFDRALGSVQV